MPTPYPFERPQSFWQGGSTAPSLPKWTKDVSEICGLLQQKVGSRSSFRISIKQTVPANAPYIPVPVLLRVVGGYDGTSAELGSILQNSFLAEKFSNKFSSLNFGYIST
jgi:hypothetical protein